MAATLIGRRICLYKNNFCKISKRNGYIVLLPEIGENLPEKNPLLKEDTKLPEFNKFTIEKCIAAVGKQAIESEQSLRNFEEIVNDMKDEEIFDKLIIPLEEMSTPLETTWGITKALYYGSQTLMPTKLFEHIQNRTMRGKLHKFQSLKIYEACNRAYENESLNLSQEERQVLWKFMLESRLNGIGSANLEEITHWQTEIRNDQHLFRAKYQEAKKTFQHKITDPHLVRDFPPNFLALLAEDPSNPQQGPWIVRYDPTVIEKFLQYCPDQVLRFTVWEDYVKFISMEYDQWLQASINIEGIRINRNKYAQALGYKHYAEMSMETKMAENLENVYNALNTVVEVAKPCQKVELEELRQFAKERGFGGVINEWDIPYWSRKQLRTKYQYEKEVFRDYFPLSRVLDGLFSICERLFNIKIVEERRVDGWHKDVRFFDIFDLSESSTEPLSSFYLDPYTTSEHKQLIPGSSTTIKYRSTYSGDKTLVALIFNFQAPTPERESLLTFEDVGDLFEKFGYALRNLLQKTNYHFASEPFEWDAYNITGFFLQNKVYEPSTINNIARHYETGEPLPTDVIKNLINTRNNMAAYKLCREMYLSELDLELHSSPDYWRTLSIRLWKKYLVFPRHNNNDHVCSWTDIWMHEWGAAYYSTFWSRMCAADAYSAFHEGVEGDEKHELEIGKRFRDTFLTYGGIYPMSEVFRQFRGRDPSPLAILKTYNLKMPETEDGPAMLEENKKTSIE